MAQIRTLKVHPTDGIPTEHALSDEVTYSSFTVSGGGQHLAVTGLYLGATPISAVTNITFNDPTANTINQTAGTLIIDNLMAKERSNLLTTAGEVLFPVVTNSSSQLDNFQLPQVAGAPTATPSNSGEGFMVWNSTDNDLYVWNGVAWDNLNIVEQANQVANLYTAGEILGAAKMVYISSANTVSLAAATATPISYAIGFSEAAAAATDPVAVVSEGVLPGFSGLVAGSRYYLSATAAGVIDPTIPTGTGNIVVKAGIAKNSTTLHIQIEDLGRRA